MPKRIRIGRHDRIVLDGAHYRAADEHAGRYALQLVNGYTLEDYFVDVTDDEIRSMMAGERPRMRIDEKYWTSSLALMRMRRDTSDRSVLTEAQKRTVDWKHEWVRRWHARRRDLTRPRIGLTPESLASFVEAERDAMDAWYLRKFGERRKPGRVYKDRERKAFDYPSPSALYEWLVLFREKREREEAFYPKYANCGNRDQLDPRVRAAMERAVEYYCTPLKLKIRDIQDFVERQLEEYNVGRAPEARLRVSDETLRKRIGEIDPFLADVGRDGLDRALRRYSLTGVGALVQRALQRVEIDDWDVDLQTLITESSIYRKLPPKKRKAVPRMRCTVTIAIDVATRCVVGFHLFVGAPSTATAKSALYSMLVDKTKLAEQCKCDKGWPMGGRAELVVTDGGPAFGEEFKMAAARARISHSVPDQDPRMRGTVESFFRSLKRFCRMFAGQTFANVVERKEYDSEKAASLTMEEFLALLVRFIVDSYHNREHRGLEGRTPLAVWNEKVGAGLLPDLSGAALHAAFGFRVTRTLGPHGIRFMNVDYVVGEHIEDLFRAVGRSQVEIVVDPNDVRTILVALPRSAKDREWSPEGTDYISLSPVEGTFEPGLPTTLDALLLARKEVREFARREAEEGRPIRLRADGDRWDAGIHAMRRAGIPLTGYTQKQLNGMLAQMEMKGTAATSSVARSEEPVEIAEGSFGDVAHAAPRKRTRKTPASPTETGPTPTLDQPKPETGTPFGGSMNTYGDDE